MSLLKKLIFSLLAMLLIAVGGSGTQSLSTIAQGMGILAIFLGIIIFLVFSRMILRAAGCLISLMIFIGITVFILYAIGAFADGIDSAPSKLKSFLSGSSQGVIDTKTKAPSRPMLNQSLPPAKKKNSKKTFNPSNYTAITTPVKVIKGNLLRLYNGRYIKLFGIDAPDLTQTCSNRQGRSYKCGRQSKAWLKGWISGYDLKCHILDTDEKGNYLGVCYLGEYDIASATVSAGWAVATPEGGGYYKEQENLANANRRGLWQGQFYRPSDWRYIKSKKADIKVIKRKSDTKNKIWGFFGF